MTDQPDLPTSFELTLDVQALADLEHLAAAVGWDFAAGLAAVGTDAEYTFEQLVSEVTAEVLVKLNDVRCRFGVTPRFGAVRDPSGCSIHDANPWGGDGCTCKKG